jgi:hypothetical protein
MKMTKKVSGFLIKSCVLLVISAIAACGNHTSTSSTTTTTDTTTVSSSPATTDTGTHVDTLSGNGSKVVDSNKMSK